jgi:hypothetical protein
VEEVPFSSANPEQSDWALQVFDQHNFEETPVPITNEMFKICVTKTSQYFPLTLKLR